MPTYTVHAPPPRTEQTQSDPERFVFVRDGFHFWAFALAPLWFLLQRLWLVLLGYIVVSLLLGGLYYLTGTSGTLRFVGSLLFAILIGMEAASLKRWTLTRRGWRNVGFVVGDGEENAEHRFFAEWTRRTSLAPPPSVPPPSVPQQYAMPVRRGAPSGTDVIGLFPEPGGGR